MIHSAVKIQAVGEKLLIIRHCWARLFGEAPRKSTDRGFDRACTRVVLPTHPRRSVLGLPASTAAFFKWLSTAGARGEPDARSSAGHSWATSNRAEFPPPCLNCKARLRTFPVLPLPPDLQLWSPSAPPRPQTGNKLSGEARHGSALMFIACSVTRHGAAERASRRDGRRGAAERFGRTGPRCGGGVSCLPAGTRTSRTPWGRCWDSYASGCAGSGRGGRGSCCEAAGGYR